MKMQQRNAFVFICVFILFTFCILTNAHANEVIRITQAPEIIIDGDEFEFDVVVDGFNGNGTISAKAIVATYDSDGKMIAMGVERVNSYGLAAVYVPMCGNEVSYKIMIHDRNIDLKPLCAEYKGSFLSNENECLKLKSNDIRYFTAKDENVIAEYYIGNSNDTSIIKFAKDLELYMNNSSENYFELETIDVLDVLERIFYTDNILLEFYDSDNDQVYDILKAYDYKYGILNNISSNSITIDGYVYELDDDFVVNFENTTGTKLSIDDFASGDFVAYMYADILENENTTNRLTIIKYDNFVSGKVEAIYTSNGYDYVSVKDIEYVSYYDNNISLGDEGKFYIGYAGEIVYFVQDKSNINYAYLLEAALSDSSFTADYWQVKLLTKDKGVVIYDTTDNASAEFSYMFDYLIDKYTYSVEWEIEANADRLIVYELDSQNRIKHLETPDFEFLPISSDDEYNSKTQMIGNYSLSDDVVIFLANDYYADELSVKDLSYLVDEGIYEGAILVDDDGKCSIMIITAAEVSLSSRAGLAIATKVAYTQDSYENEVIEVSFVQNGEEQTLLITDDTISKNANVYADEITPGSTFVYSQTEGVIDVLYVTSLYNDDKTELMVDSYGVMGEDTEVIYGYIANTSRKSVSGGELVTIADAEGEFHNVLITNDTNKYTYDDRFMEPYIYIDDFLATDNTWYFDEESGVATPVIVKIYDGEVTDICSFNTSVNIEDMTASDSVAMLGIGATEYPGEIVEINSGDIVNPNENTNIMVYYTNPSDYTYGELTKIKIDNNAKLYLNRSSENYLNGSVFSMETMMDFIDDCELILEDSDGDKDYDVINAEIYHYEIVEYVDAERSQIILDGKNVYLNSNGIDVEIFDNNGNEITLGDIKDDDTIAWFCDGTRPTTSNYIKIIKCVGIEGVVESTWTSKGVDYAEIGGKTYKVDEYSDINVGDYGIFYTNHGGNVIEYFEWIDTSEYGYILEAALSDSSFTADRWQVKLLTKDHGVVIYDTTDDASDMFFDVFYDLIDKYNYSIEWEVEANPDRLIKFKLDSQGRIKMFNTHDFRFREIDEYDEYNSNNQMIGGYCLSDDITIFLVNDYNTNKLCIKDLSYLVDEGIYEGAILVDDDGKCSVMIVTSGDIGFSIDEGLAIVTKVTRTLDSDDNEVTRINFVQNEEECVVVFNDDSLCVNPDYDIDDMRVGVSFVYTANSDSVVERYAILSTIDDGSISIANLNDINLGRNVEMHCGYISNTRKNSTSKGELIEVSEEYSFMITDSTNKYTYDNSGRNIIIEVGDFLAGDAWYAYDDEVTPVIIRTVDDVVTDIYTSGQRILIYEY